VSRAVCFALGFALAVSLPVVAQTDTAAQVRQLTAYVQKLGAQYVEFQKRSTAELVRLKDAHNELVVFTLDLNCRVTKTNQVLEQVSKATDSQPVVVTLLYGKACNQVNDAPKSPSLLD
jgi:hypothetical protein